MTSVEPRLPEQFRVDANMHVSELATDHAGPVSPYGDDIEFPLPLDKIRYTHPGPADRPNLADGR
jgi:hypothetical protein